MLFGQGDFALFFSVLAASLISRNAGQPAVALVALHTGASRISIHRDSVTQQNQLVQRPRFQTAGIFVFLWASYLCVSALGLPSAEFLITLLLVSQMLRFYLFLGLPASVQSMSLCFGFLGPYCPVLWGAACPSCSLSTLFC